MLVYLFMMNVGMQGLFVYLLASTGLTKPQYDSESVVQYRSWRRNEAHQVDNYDRLTDRTLAARVCAVRSRLHSGAAELRAARIQCIDASTPFTLRRQGDLLSQSATIAGDYEEVKAYLDTGGAKGTLMLGLALFAWYCTVSREINATIDSYHVTRSIPYGNATKIKKDPISGEFTVEQLSKERLAIRMGVSFLRLITAGFMFYQGTQFLVYTIDIGDLLLNAVALEFVISTDELIFTCLGPSTAKRVIRRTK